MQCNKLKISYTFLECCLKNSIKSDDTNTGQKGGCFFLGQFSCINTSLPLYIYIQLANLKLFLTLYVPVWCVYMRAHMPQRMYEGQRITSIFL